MSRYDDDDFTGFDAVLTFLTLGLWLVLALVFGKYRWLAFLALPLALIPGLWVIVLAIGVLLGLALLAAPRTREMPAPAAVDQARTVTLDPRFGLSDDAE